MAEVFPRKIHAPLENINTFSDKIKIERCSFIHCFTIIFMINNIQQPMQTLYEPMTLDTIGIMVTSSLKLKIK